MPCWLKHRWKWLLKMVHKWLLLELLRCHKLLPKQTLMIFLIVLTICKVVGCLLKKVLWGVDRLEK